MSVVKDGLATKRLLLRRWRDADLEPFAAINQDPLVMEYFQRPNTREETAGIMERTERSFDDEGFGLWAVELISTGELMGFVGLNRPGWESSFTPCVEIGWRMGSSFWGHGYAPEAARKVLEDGFERVGLDEILSWTAVINAKSIRVMEKIGLERDQTMDFDHPLVPEGHRLRRHVMYRAKSKSYKR